MLPPSINVYMRQAPGFVSEDREVCIQNKKLHLWFETVITGMELRDNQDINGLWFQTIQRGAVRILQR